MQAKADYYRKLFISDIHSQFFESPFTVQSFNSVVERDVETSIHSNFAIFSLGNSHFYFYCFQELIQNADDANATEVVFIHDERSYGTESLWTNELKEYQGITRVAVRFLVI